MSTARSKLFFSPSGGTNEGGMTEDEGGILSDREHNANRQLYNNNSNNVYHNDNNNKSSNNLYDNENYYDKSNPLT